MCAGQVPDLLPLGLQQPEELVIGRAAAFPFAGVDQQVARVAGQRLGGPRVGVGRPAQEQRPVRVMLRCGMVITQDGRPLAAREMVAGLGLVRLVGGDGDARLLHLPRPVAGPGSGLHHAPAAQDALEPRDVTG